jgi:hypothetical protein
VAGELLLARHAELAVGAAHRQHDGVGEVHVGADLDALGRAREVDRGDVVGDELRAEALRLLAQHLHELRAHDAVGEAGEVLDVGGVHQRATRGDGALEDEGGEAGARQVDRGGVAGRAGADDDALAGLAHGASLWAAAGDGLNATVVTGLPPRAVPAGPRAASDRLVR